MSGPEGPTESQEGFETAMRGEGGEVPMPSVAAESRGRVGEPEDQDIAEAQAGEDRRRVVEGYVRPGEPHTD